MSADLLRRIEEFAIDGPGAPALPFAARLAREHGWHRGYAERVVREYKRFVYLALTAGHPVCPSEQVDAAWHLHLTYTRSYWKRFCGEVLGTPLHHDPTKGGPAEADKHLRMYEETLAAYRRAFGEEPPGDIWPPAGVRFGDDLRHVVVNTRHNWVVPKAWVRHAAVGIAAAVALVPLGAGCGKGLNPFKLAGADYLVFLIPVMLAAVALGLVIRSARKGPSAAASEDVPELTWEQAAYLAGGPRRLLSAALTRLVLARAAVVSDGGQQVRQAGPMPDGLTPVEREVFLGLPLDKSDPKAAKALAERVGQAFGEDVRRLHDAGLALPPGQAAATCLLAALPLAAVITVFGVPRLVLAMIRDKPAGYLVFSLVAGLVVFIMLLVIRPLRTRRGDALMKQLKARRTALQKSRQWVSSTDAALAVALFGTAVLVGTELAGLYAWFPRHTTGGGGCGAGCGAGGGGGGGCGGGGCGGCGGGD